MNNNTGFSSRAVPRASHASTFFLHRSPISLAALSLVSAAFAVLPTVSAAQAAPAVAASAPAATDTPASAPTLPTVKVTATAADDALRTDRVSAGALGARKQVDTPFSTDVKSSEDIKDLRATSVNDVFKYDPAVSIVGNGRTGENSTFSIRGIQLDQLNGNKIDGQSFTGWDMNLPLEAFEQVQLLKGLSGFMYGFSAPGGIVNYVLKRPTDEPYHAFTFGYESAGVFTESADLGGRFGNDKRFGYRLNAVNEDGNTAEANGHIRRQVASLALDFRVTPDLTLTADALYQKTKQNGTLFDIMIYGANSAIPDASRVTRSLTQPQNWYETETTSVGTGLQYRISDDWKASVNYRFSKLNRYNDDSLLWVNDAQGDYSNTLYTALTRYFYSDATAMVQGKFSTGFIKHDVAFGAEYSNQTAEYDNQPGGLAGGYSLGTGNIYTPITLYNPAVSFNSQLYRQNTTTQAALFASDTMQFTDRLSALVGVRYTHYRQDVYNVDQTYASQYGKSPVTPTGAIMFKTDAYSTAYASYVESLEQGGAASAFNANYPQVFGPLRSKQYEVGFKTDRERWGGNVALFRIDRGYDYTNTANIFVQDGTERYMGLDASAWFSPVRDWRVMAGVLALNAKGVGIDDASVNGKRIYGTPRFQATARVEYSPSVVHGLTLDAGVKYTGNMALDAANQFIVPSYTTVDIGGKYDTEIGGKSVTFRAGINNLFDKRYWTTGYGYYVLPGAVRTFIANATVEF
ncbi:TonB-dependent siderophore receptor [Paraburkholderia acidisoli]|uniref:TonB-dependent siderophore receptor n=1 Tax=Paraburkholderia acidisoli TaxID=2571748 RepID=A0A7Z2GPG3_9BURK|nr:TonB-dependent siderophore receptor [Paraburkholderia acidisoli]